MQVYLDVIMTSYVSSICNVMQFITISRVISSQAMWLMLQQETPEDLVIATGDVHSVREFVVEAFKQVGKTIV